MNPLMYRPDIDGLRAIAIIFVVLCHYGATWLRGGFIGVDVFFVISGYLISGIIFTEIKRGDFSFITFYLRRARRVLPALIAVSVLVMVFNYFVFLPVEFKQQSASLFASLLFAGNIYFYNTANYFGPAATQSPFLPYWSLGVEEQFYLIIPFIIAAISRWQRAWQIAVVIIASVISLGTAEYMLHLNRDAAFYLLPFRAWELLAGMVAFLCPPRSISTKASAAIAVSGLVMIICSALLLNNISRFPGIAAMPACIGTALIIWSGIPTLSLVHKMLGTKPLRSIGKISFSLYLVHWPIYIIALRLWPEPNVYLREILAAVIALILASGFYYGVETPFRKLSLEHKKRRALQVGATIGAAVAICAAIYLANGIEQRSASMLFAKKDILAVKYASYIENKDVAQFGGKCFLYQNKTFADFSTSECLPTHGENAVVLWGDSGVAQYASALKDAFRNIGLDLGQITLSGCPPFVGYDISIRPQCHEFNDRALETIVKLRPRFVILGSAFGDAGESNLHLEETLDKLNTAHISVVLLGPGPRFLEPIPQLLVRRIKADNTDAFSNNELDLNFINVVSNSQKEIIKRHPPAKWISAFDLICPDKKCLLVKDDIPLHFDNVHTTAEGARFHVSRFFDAITKSFP